jgi:F-type H+-transporting ATPase subunit gamma
MAQNLQQLKKRIKTLNSISQIAKAMEVVSTFKARKAQSSVKKHNVYVEKIKHMIRRVLVIKNFNNEVEMLFKQREGRKLIYLISPNKGLCGGLVTRLFKKVDFYVKRDDYVVAIGKKAVNEIIKRNFSVVASFDMLATFPKYDDVYPLVDIAEEYCVLKKVTNVSVIFSEFKNMFTQRAVIDEIFPIKFNNFLKDLKENKRSCIFEPDLQQILEELFPCYFEAKLYNALLNAYTSEQTARIIAMKNATHNASDISISLTNIYNKSRQEKITNEILNHANGQQEI